MLPTVFVSREISAHGVITFWFKTARPLSFTPGQFTELHVPHDKPDNRGVWRHLSIASSPTEPLLGFTTKVLHARPSTFKQALFALKPGDPVFVTEPLGDFVLPKDTTLPLVFVAAGIGITPFRSMLVWLNHTGQKRPVQLIYGVRAPEQFAFLDIIEQAVKSGVEFLPVISQAKSASHWNGRIGKLSALYVLELTDDPAAKLLYLAGPQSLIEPMFYDLQTLGVPRTQLPLDYFSGY